MITEFPLFLFTLLGGIASGAYMVAPFFLSNRAEGKRRMALPLASLALLAIGGVALLMHLGRSDHVLYAFSNPRAGITAEGYATVFFGVMVLVDAVMTGKKGQSPKPVRVLCALGGLAMSCAMAYAYFSYYSVPAWHNAAAVLLFLAGNLAVGLAFCGLLEASAYDRRTFGVTSVVASVVLLVSLIVLGVMLNDLGLDAGLIVAGAAVLAFAVGLELVAIAGKGRRFVAVAVALFVVVGLALARYAFYAAV